MMPTREDPRGVTSTRIINHVCRQFAEAGTALPIAIAGLPADTVAVAAAHLVIAATSLAAPTFVTEAVRACERTGSDVLLIHHGLVPELLDPVVITAVTFGLAEVTIEREMVFGRAADGSLLLAPPCGDWAYAATTTGLRRMASVFSSVDARSEAVCAFAAEIARLVRSSR